MIVGGYAVAYVWLRQENTGGTGAGTLRLRRNRRSKAHPDRAYPTPGKPPGLGGGRVAGQERLALANTYCLWANRHAAEARRPSSASAEGRAPDWTAEIGPAHWALCATAPFLRCPPLLVLTGVHPP